MFQGTQSSEEINLLRKDSKGNFSFVGFKKKRKKKKVVTSKIDRDKH